MDANHVANQNGLEMEERTKVHSALLDQMKNDVVLNINELMEIQEPSSLTETSCIYKVPNDIRLQNADAYTPKVVSIGPLHHGNPTLQNMETYKRILFKKFIQRAMPSLDNLVSSVINFEPRVRACYSENILLTKEKFMTVVLIDASFIFTLFLLKHDKDWLEKDSYLRQPQLMANITLDLLLLENQLPFFIVDELFNVAFPSHIRGEIPSFIELTFHFFSDFKSQLLKPRPEIYIEHFTDLLRKFHVTGLKDFRRPTGEYRIHNLLYSINAHGLFEAGVKFKGRKRGCLLDLKFSRGVLEIPQILVDKSTETLFRNMIALEQFKYPHETFIADYAFVLDRLINKSIDVDVLIGAKIIKNNLGESDDVAKLFNGLGQSIPLLNLNLAYFVICLELNEFYKDPYEHFQNPYNYRIFTLRRDYCNTPWRALASVAGIVLLILTLVQTIFTVKK